MRTSDCDKLCTFKTIIKCIQTYLEYNWLFVDLGGLMDGTRACPEKGDP